MAFTVDIDTGGTFTDGLFADGKEIKKVKVDTTPHDLTISWLNCIKEGAAKFGFSKLEEFLEYVDIVRWSNTIASNVIAEKKGPKLGLFLTDGYQKTLYSPAKTKKSSVFGSLIEETNVETVKLPLDTDDLLIRLKKLLEKGVRRICISLKDGLKNIKDEMKIKEIFEEQYPDHYLGNVPLLLGGDICKHPDDMTRTHMALLNSYVHGPMAQSMFKAEDELRERGFLKPILLGHTDGGVSRVSKTKPVDTIESGPIFGIFAGAYWADLYQIPHVITLDVGGTTTKIGLLEDLRPAVTREPDILGVPLNKAALDLKSIALGGGTVANVTNSTLHLGPHSMGAYPGPACYDLGGSETTLTDAYLVRGFIDPQYFFGGTKKLNYERAEKIIQKKVADPLDVDFQVAAYQISSKATQIIADEIKKLIQRTGRTPRDFTLFAFGGNGAIVGCEIAEQTDMKNVLVFSLGSVLSTFGSSVADISHTYEYSPILLASEDEALVNIVQWMIDEARRDMEGEGFDPSNVDAELELTLYNNKDPENLIQLTCPWAMSKIETKAQIQMLNDCLTKSKYGSKSTDMTVEILRLKTKTPISKIKPREFKKVGKDPEPAIKGEREVFYRENKVTTQVYEWDKLQTGNIIPGPAIVEGSDSTYIVPQEWQILMDSFRNGVLERRK